MKAIPVRTNRAGAEPGYSGWRTIPNGYGEQVMFEVGSDWALNDLQHGLHEFSRILMSSGCKARMAI